MLQKMCLVNKKCLVSKMNIPKQFMFSMFFLLRIGECMSVWEIPLCGPP